MKLISLNIWGGHEYDTLISFLKNHADNTDIFCFQEVYTSPQSAVSNGTRINIFEELKNIFPDYRSFFAPIQKNIDEEGPINIPTTFGQAIFVKETLAVEKEGFVFAYRGPDTMAGNDFSTLGHGFQYIKIKNGDAPLIIISVHGISIPGNKLDTKDRLIQSEKIKNFLKDIPQKKIVCGDFNLMPNTQSIKILEQDMKNLIKEFKISDTRGELNAKKYLNDPSPQRFADYMFISPDITITSFQVPNVEISDHLPLILEFFK